MRGTLTLMSTLLSSIALFSAIRFSSLSLSSFDFEAIIAAENSNFINRASSHGLNRNYFSAIAPSYVYNPSLYA